MNEKIIKVVDKKKSVRARSNKSKGRGGEKEVQQLLLEAFPQLEPDDCRCTGTGSNGEDLLLSPQARKLLNMQIEVKRKKAIGAVRFYEQAGEHGKYEPAVFMREDRGEWLTIISSKYYLKLLGGYNKQE